MSGRGRHFSFGLLAILGGAGLTLAGASPAFAGKVHWKDDPNVPGCSALAFDDTDEWFAGAEGDTFKRGICHGQRLTFKVVLAPDRESFTVSGANFCQFHVGENHEITAGCRAGKAR